MAYVTTNDGVKLYYEEAGSGDPIVFVHEFGGHHLSWETQMRFFSRRYRCITYQARGWPPSDVPKSADAYSQERAADDIADVMSGLGLTKAHVVGLSMGATAGLEFAIRHPGKGLSITAAGAGTGSSRDPEQKKRFAAEATAVAERIEKDGIKVLGDVYLNAASRQQLRLKDPRGFAEFHRQFVEGASEGRAYTMRGVQAKRLPFFEREAELRATERFRDRDETEAQLDRGRLHIGGQRARRLRLAHPGAQRLRLLAGLGRQVDVDARRR